jgi:AAA domain (dynein-related subfamily)/EVE domain
LARIPGGATVYEAADLFRLRCLIEGKSLLWPQRAVWTLPNTSALWDAFMGHPDTGKRTFLEKWHDQLLNEQEDVHRVAVELIAFYELFPMNIGTEAKLRELDTIIGWKLSQDKPDLSLLVRPFEHGIGSPGIHYLTGKPWQLAFYLQFFIHVIRDKIDPRNAETCKQLADLVLGEIHQSASARHILLHLLFPDQFESMASEAHKRRIVDAFSVEAAGNEDLDSALSHIRKALQQKYKREIDFYERDLQPLWRGDEADPVQFWIEKTIVRDRPDREKGEFALGKALWSPRQDKRGGDIYRYMRHVQPGDVILHLTDNEAITAISRAESGYQDFNGVADTEWGLGPSYLVRLRDTVFLNPPLSRSVFFSTPYKERLVALIDAGTKNLFFNREPSLNQGAYLTPAPSELIHILDDAYTKCAGKSLTEIVPEIATISKTMGVGDYWIFQANPDFYDIRRALQALTQQTWLIARFKNEIRPGDKTYLWESGPDGGIVGVAEVTGPPRMGPMLEAERPFAKSPDKFEGEQLRATLKILRVVDPPISRKTLLSHSELTGLSIFRQPQGTNFRLTKEEARVLDAVVSGSEPSPSQVSLSDLGEVTNLPVQELQEIESLLRAKKQLILEGPPGSGKTYVAELFARYFSGNRLDDTLQKNLLTIQFHQSYSYEDFIQGIRPKTTAGGQLSYQVEPGIFKAFCDEARNSEKPFVMVIDEINRGNISRIFGELLFLVEYRGKTIPLPYDRSPFSIPSNVYLIGTMNTTDRSLAQIDYALRRRFYFYRLMPVTNDRAPVLEKALLKLDVLSPARDRVLRLFIALNNRIQERLGEHFQVGHSHFMRADIGNEQILGQVWNRAVLPLLEEYFYNSRDRGSVLSEFTIEKLLSDKTGQHPGT